MKVGSDPWYIEIMANPRTKSKPVTDNLDVVRLSIPQVKAFFPIPWAQALKDYELNVKCAKEDEDWDPKEPGILSPAKCVWTLQKSEDYGDSLSDYPGYALHFYDEVSIASFHGGGSDVVWVGDSWEM